MSSITWARSCWPLLLGVASSGCTLIGDFGSYSEGDGDTTEGSTSGDGDLGEGSNGGEDNSTAGGSHNGSGSDTGNSGGKKGSGGDGSGSSSGSGGNGSGSESSSGGDASDSGGAGSGGDDGSGGNVTASGGAGSGGADNSSKPPVNASTGCGKANPQTGTSGSPLNVSGHNYYVKLPAGYDPAQPYKVMIVFPPTGNPITWSEDGAGYEQAAPEAIRVYTHMANVNSGWQPSETSFFKPLYDELASKFCIDKNRVFAAGESAGGEFAGFVGCEYGDLLLGIASGAAKVTSWNGAAHACQGHPTAIVIWSEMDTVLGQPAGPFFRDFYRDLNTCEVTSAAVAGYIDKMSNCKMFDGCMEGSNVYYCMHEDPNYSNTYHGWPGFAGKMTWEVFSEL